MSMKQVAALAGLDTSTVSRALRGDTTRVASATIERVQAIAREIGYVPDPIASSLRSGRTGVIGVLVPSLSDIVMGILVTAIDDAAHELGYLSTVVATQDDPRKRTEALDRLLHRRIDGLILCDSAVGVPLSANIAGRGTPHVLAMRSSDDELSVSADDRLGGAIVARHFASTGHRRVAVVPGPSHARTAVDREAGFREEAIKLGLSVSSPRTAPGGFSVRAGYEAVGEMIAAGDAATAIFCTNDHAAIGAGRAISDARRRIGVDLALVGYNDIPQAGYLETPLTSVRTDISAMGELATRALVAALTGQPSASVLLKPTLVVRASSAGGSAH